MGYLKRLFSPAKQLSVIVPIYDGEEYVEECLQSIARSIDRIDAEVLLIDDDAVDSSGSIACEFAKTHPQFIYRKRPHGGLAAVRNYAIKHARGTYIAFADSDDIVAPNAYREMIDAAQKHSADMVVSNARRIKGAEERASSLHVSVFEALEEGVIDIGKDVSLVYDTTSWNKLIRRSFWKKSKAAFPVGCYFEDIPVMFMLHCKANPAVAVNTVSYYWRIRTGNSRSITQRYEERVVYQHRLDMLDLVFEHYNTFQKGNERLLTALKRKILTVDLVMHVREIKNLGDEDADWFMEQSRAFLQRYFQEEDLSLASPKWKGIYESVLLGDRSAVVAKLKA